MMMKYNAERDAEICKLSDITKIIIEELGVVKIKALEDDMNA